jgi:hypothetical protein
VERGGTQHLRTEVEVLTTEPHIYRHDLETKKKNKKTTQLKEETYKLLNELKENMNKQLSSKRIEKNS